MARDTPRRVVDTQCETGEGPLWHADEEALYWCDIPNGRLFRYDPDRDDHERVLDGTDALGGFTIQRDGSLLLFRAGGRVERFDGGDPETVATVGDASHTRFNDVIADPEGRVFAGTMPTEERPGRIYRFETDGEIMCVDGAFDLPNGMGFPSSLDALLLTESNAKTIHEFAYDRTTGEITDRRPFLDVTGEESIPDGMTIDAGGNVWSARWNGGAVVRYDKSGTEYERVEFPARKVSSVTFGGPDYRTAYVTTAGGDDRNAEGDGAGALFAFDAPDGVSGRPEFQSAFPAD